VMYFIIIHYLSFLLFFLPSLLYQSHFWVHVLYIFICVYIILLIFVLGLYSTYNRKHVAFGFLNLANFI
jgi:hypothetical protein